MVAPYRRLLTLPRVGRLIGIDLLIKLGTPVLSVALLLAVIEQRSYAAGGLVLAGHALAVAAAAPVGGRLVDRYPPRRVQAGYLALHAISYVLLLGMLAADPAAVPTVALVATAVVIGATVPPAGIVIRAAWPRLVPDDLLPTAYAVSTASNELMFIAGPLLVAVLLLVMPATAIVAAAGAAVLLGVILLLPASPALAGSAGRADARTGLARLLGPLTHPGTLRLLVLAGLGAAAFGCLRIGTAASATALGTPAAAGLLLGLLSAGALAGGLGYGAAARPSHRGRLLVLLCLVDTAILLVAAATAAAPLAILAAVITLSGLVSGPRETLQQTLLARHGSNHSGAEVFAWLNTFMWAGYGLGTTLAGALTPPAGNGTVAFAIAAATALVGAALMIVRTRPGSGEEKGSPTMSVIRTTRFTVDASDVNELVTRRARLIDAIRAVYPGLVETRLTRLEDGSFADAWRWESAEHLDTALATGPTLPEAGPVFALIGDATADTANLIDAR